MSLATTGITTTIVKGALGESTNAVGSLCTSNSINKWSFYKPINSTKSTGLVDSDYWTFNDGFSIPTYTTPITIINGKIVSNNLQWSYIKPTTTYRLGDFRGYDHSASDWYTFELDSESNPNGSDVVINLPTLSTLSQFYEFSGTSINLGFLITTGTSTGQTSVNYYCVSDQTYPTIEDLENTLKVTLSGSIFSNSGYYNIIPVVCTYPYTAGNTYNLTTASAQGTWYCFDSAKLYYHSILTRVINNIYSCTGYIDGNGFYVITNLQVRFTNEYNSSKSINYTIGVNNEAGYSAFSLSSSTTVAANSYSTITAISTSNYPSGYVCRADVPLISVLDTWSEGSYSDEYYLENYI